MSFIPEGDVYRLITHSKLPSAEQFKRWVTYEVLPLIRKHGVYVDDEPWFVAADMCRALEISNVGNAVAKLDDDEKMTIHSMDGHSGQRCGAQFMYSMDFEEFLRAKGYGDDTVMDMLSHMKTLKPFSELEMSVYHSLFLDFSILGGMPAVVSEYIRKNTFEGSLDIQKQLISDYREDIRKYAEGVDQTRIINVFNRIAPQLARENKKFQISKVAPGARFRDYRGCAEWLADAGMVNICYCMDFPELPLGGNYDPDVFKLYFADTGLLVSMLDDESQEDLRANKNLGVYKGALYENMAGEALVKQGYKLYYYKREDSTLEEDLFIRSASSLIPLEVKARSGKAKSMNTLITSDRYPDIFYGFKLSYNNIGHESGIYTFPYFCAFLLKRFVADFHADEEKDKTT